jgi:hypothetical protein
MNLSARNWIAVTLLATLCLGGGLAAMNARTDIYGLFRDTRGRRLPIYDSERRGKYLLSQRYVPENFQAVLLGSSVTSNWNTAGIELYPTYNESTDGGNVSEQKLLAETVLRAGGLKMAICIVHPYMTDSPGPNSGEMSPSEYWAALGSLSLLRSYKLRRAIDSGSEPLIWDALGTEEKGDDPLELRPLNPVLTRILKSPGEVHADDGAVAEYGTLVGELRAGSVRLVAVVPPTYEPLLTPKREALDRYARRILSLFSPGDLVVDFNAPEYAAFRADVKNFRDGVHLSRRGATEVVHLLNQRLLASR